MRRQSVPDSFLMAEAVTLLCFSLLFFYSHALVSPGSSNSTIDELALLAFKSMLSSPSNGLLASWNTSSHYCSWPGVVCSRRQPEGGLTADGFLQPFRTHISVPGQSIFCQEVGPSWQPICWADTSGARSAQKASGAELEHKHSPREISCSHGRVHQPHYT